MPDDGWVLAGRRYTGRVMHCFGTHPGHRLDPETAVAMLEASQTEFIPVYTHGALAGLRKRADLPLGYAGLRLGDLEGRIDLGAYTLLVNVDASAGVADALRRAELGVALTGSPRVKLEVLDAERRRSRNAAVVEATPALVSEGYRVLPLIDLEADTADRLLDHGCVALRVAMADLGSCRGLPHPDFYLDLASRSPVPVVAEGGLGAPEDARAAVAAGAAAVLANSALFAAPDPVAFLRAVRLAAEEGARTARG